MTTEEKIAQIDAAIKDAEAGVEKFRLAYGLARAQLDYLNAQKALLIKAGGTE
jgi:uncharacterized protein involved in exopolysaccharide biosynthesis